MYRAATYIDVHGLQIIIYIERKSKIETLVKFVINMVKNCVRLETCTDAIS